MTEIEDEGGELISALNCIYFFQGHIQISSRGWVWNDATNLFILVPLTAGGSIKKNKKKAFCQMGGG